MNISQFYRYSTLPTLGIIYILYDNSGKFEFEKIDMKESALEFNTLQDEGLVRFSKNGMSEICYLTKKV